jgi:hypothetical protein
MTQTPTEIRSLAPAIAQLRAHVVRVRKANRIENNYERHASASYRPPEIWIRPIRSPRAYAVALHEIGHIIGRYQMKKSVMVRERWAWEWARRKRLAMDAGDGATWIVPIGGGFGRIFKLGDQPVSANIAGYYNVVHPTGTSNWQLRAELSLLFPER